MKVERAYARHSRGGSYNWWLNPTGGRVGEGWVIVTDTPSLTTDADARGPQQPRTHAAFGSWDEAMQWLDAHDLRPSGWRRAKGGDYVPDPAGTDVPCDRSTRGGDHRWTTYARCDRRCKPGEDACGMHLAHDRKAAERKAERKAERERSEAGERIAQDAVAALALRGIEGRRHYHVPFGSGMGRYTGEVCVPAEDMLAMLRRLDAAEALLGDDMPA